MSEHRQVPKVPYPRQLTKKETLDSLSHWQTSVKNYFRRFPDSAEFFKRNSSWTQAENYGFVDPGANDKADNLEALLDTIASFLPGPYITHKITKTSTSIASVWDIIFIIIVLNHLLPHFLIMRTYNITEMTDK